MPRLAPASCRFALALAVVAVCALAPRALRAQPRIAALDVQRAATSTQEGAGAQAALRALFNERQSGLDRRQTALRAEQADIEARQRRGERGAELAQRTQAYQSALADLQREFTTAQGELNRREQEATARIIERMRQVAEVVRARGRYDVVLDRAAPGNLATAPGVTDVTSQVVAEYDRAFPAQGTGHPLPAPAAQPARRRRGAPRLAVFDLSRALLATYDGVHARDRLRQLFDARQRDLDQRSAAIQSDARQLAAQRAQLPAGVVAQREHELQRRTTALQSDFNAYTTELQRREREETSRLETALRAVVDQVRAQSGYDTVYERDAVVAGAAGLIDVTTEVTAAYDRAHPGATPTTGPSTTPNAAPAGPMGLTPPSFTPLPSAP